MVAEIRVPQMGESVTEGVVGPWLKKEGDPVSPDEPVVTLETEKVAVDVVPEQAGTLERILQPEGASVKPGDVLATVAPLAATSVAGTSVPSLAGSLTGEDGMRSVRTGLRPVLIAFATSSEGRVRCVSACSGDAGYVTW